MAKKSYNYAQLEAVAQEMRTNADMVFFYEYQTPTATLPTGEVLDLAKEFGSLRTSGRGWPIDEQWIAGVGHRRGGGRLESGRAHADRWRRSTPSSTSRTRPARSAR